MSFGSRISAALVALVVNGAASAQVQVDKLTQNTVLALRQSIELTPASPTTLIYNRETRQSRGGLIAYNALDTSRCWLFHDAVLGRRVLPAGTQFSLTGPAQLIPGDQAADRASYVSMPVHVSAGNVAVPDGRLVCETKSRYVFLVNDVHVCHGSTAMDVAELACLADVYVPRIPGTDPLQFVCRATEPMSLLTEPPGSNTQSVTVSPRWKYSPDLLWWNENGSHVCEGTVHFSCC